MKNHYYSYDYLRAFSIIMIVLCHICHGFGLSSEIGWYLGGTFVDVFLLLSAYLLGLSSSKNIETDPCGFIRKRTGRIVPTYYTFLTISFLLIILFIGWNYLSLKQIAGHYLFLNWFWESSRISTAPLPQLGHLWFMSCIIFAYLMVLIWALIKDKFNFLNSTVSWVLYFAILSIIATFATMKIRFAVYPFTVIIGFMILFYKGKEIMDWVRRLNKVLLISLLLICNLIGVIYYLLGGYEFPTLVFWINLINACLWIATAPVIFKPKKPLRAVLFISAISFEIYLIHHPFCLGTYSLKQFMPVWLAIICVFTIGIIGGWILNKTTIYVLKTFPRNLSLGLNKKPNRN